MPRSRRWWLRLLRRKPIQFNAPVGGAFAYLETPEITRHVASACYITQIERQTEALRHLRADLAEIDRRLRDLGSEDDD